MDGCTTEQLSSGLKSTIVAPAGSAHSMASTDASDESEQTLLTRSTPNNNHVETQTPNKQKLPEEDASPASEVFTDSENKPLNQDQATAPAPAINCTDASDSVSTRCNKMSSMDKCLLKNTVSLKSSLYADEFIAEVDKHYMKVACSAVCVWVFLIVISFLIAREKNALESLTGIEQKAPMVASLLLGMSLVSSVLPLLVRNNKRCMSGVVVCAVVVQAIAFMTDLLMAFLPTPVLIDPVCGMKFYLLRYCEWAPLAFTMAFLTESCRIDDPRIVTNNSNQSVNLSTIISAMTLSVESDDFDTTDSPKKEGDLKKRVQKRLNSAYALGLSQGLSTFCGWLFPFCPNLFTWSLCMTVSCILFGVLWRRLHTRTKAFRAMKLGSTLSEQEMYNWNKLSLGLLRTCAYVWSILVFVFFVDAIVRPNLPSSNILNTPGLSMILESTLDVIFKAIYLLIVIDVHDTIFDPSARAERRLEELKRMLSAVWDNSSDMIGISVRGISGDVTTMLSPTYKKIFSDVAMAEGESTRTSKIGKALAFEMNVKHFSSAEDPIPSTVYDLDLSDLSPGKNKPYMWTKSENLKEEEMASLAKLVVRAWQTDPKEEKILLMHDLIRKRGSAVNIRCEANVTRMEENALIIVVRDISERFRRFEAEKKAVSETTARLRDAAANRFTRHEVKNGLLAAVALCNSLNEGVYDLSAKVEALEQELAEKNKLISFMRGGTNESNEPSEDSTSHELDRRQSTKKCDKIQKYNSSDRSLRSSVGDMATHRYLYELDNTLHEILDTILAEAMARDVIWEVYEPKLERVNVPKLLLDSTNVNSGMSNNMRFPINSKPVPLPDFGLDPQLLKYIHRNAVSNACKYGKKGGIITTNVDWNKEKGELRMDVINLPGEDHSAILELGDLASEVVFSPRRRLNIHCTGDNNNQVLASHSSGDGAWIMYRCAKTLGGECGIQVRLFNVDYTFVLL